jgi:hypothetical protein
MSFSSKLHIPWAAAVLVGAVAACGSGGSGGSAPSAAPSWAKALGAGVTVTSGNASPGDGSPGGSLLGALTSAEAGNFTKFCSYFPPSQQDDCNSTLSGVPAASLKTAMPTYKNVVVTYTAIDGNEALVGDTGTICDPNQTPSCIPDDQGQRQVVHLPGQRLTWSDRAVSGITFQNRWQPIAPP